MGYGFNYHCDKCNKESSQRTGMGFMYIVPENLEQAFTPAKCKAIRKVLQTPQSELEWLGYAKFSCSKCNRWRCEADFRVLDAKGEVLLGPSYRCGHCKTGLDEDVSDTLHCGKCGEVLGCESGITHVLWD